MMIPASVWSFWLIPIHTAGNAANAAKRSSATQSPSRRMNGIVAGP